MKVVLLVAFLFLPCFSFFNAKALADVDLQQYLSDDGTVLRLDLTSVKRRVTDEDVA